MDRGLTLQISKMVKRRSRALPPRYALIPPGCGQRALAKRARAWARGFCRPLVRDAPTGSKTSSRLWSALKNNFSELFSELFHRWNRGLHPYPRSARQRPSDGGYPQRLHPSAQAHGYARRRLNSRTSGNLSLTAPAQYPEETDPGFFPPPS